MMKLRYMGVCKDMTKLPTSELPENAVKFVEPESKEAIEKAMLSFLIPSFLVIGLALLIGFLLHGNINITIDFSYWWVLPIIIVFSLVAMIVHEFLHAICFGKGSEVDLYVTSSLLFVHSMTPISKRRFIFMCLLPNVVLGLIPLIVWVFVPMPIAMGTILFAFASIMLLSGCGDYMNSFNAYRQMPKGSMQQLSGMNSFWFMGDADERCSKG